MKIYRMDWKSYVLMGVFYGIGMGIAFSFLYGLIAGACAAVPCGVLFGGLMMLVLRLLEKRFITAGQQLAATKRVVCHGIATIRGVAGWMYLTEEGLEYTPRKVTVTNAALTIPTEMIKAVSTFKKVLIVETRDHVRFEFVVVKNLAWKADIEAEMAARAVVAEPVTTVAEFPADAEQ